MLSTSFHHNFDPIMFLKSFTNISLLHRATILASLSLLIIRLCYKSLKKLNVRNEKMNKSLV